MTLINSKAKGKLKGDIFSSLRFVFDLQKLITLKLQENALGAD